MEQNNRKRVLLVGFAALAVVVLGYVYMHSPRAGQGGEHPYYKELQKAHEAMMGMSGDMDMSMDHDEKYVGVLLYGGFTLLDAMGPIQTLSSVKGYKVVTVAKQKGLVNSQENIGVQAQYGFSDAPKLDVLVIPGGMFGTLATAQDTETLNWIKKVDQDTEYTTSVCTGSWILASSGLLKGKNASTHWTGAEYLESLGAHYTGERYTLDGKYLTSAGISGGIDMSLKLAELLAGTDAAKVSQLLMEYDPQPPFDAGSPAKADPQLVELLQKMSDDHIHLFEEGM